MKPAAIQLSPWWVLIYFGWVIALLGTDPFTVRAESPSASPNLIRTAEQSALLQALDDRLEQLTRLMAGDPSDAHAATVRATIDKLQARRDVFRLAAFDSGKYDELRFDLNVAYQRENLWLAPPLTKAPLPTAQVAP